MRVSENIPKHVAIVMDGNGRWARARGLSPQDGHSHCVDAARRTVRACRAQGIQYLTLYAFDVGNWERPRSEVRALMDLLARFAEECQRELQEQGIRLAVIGDVDELTTPARRAIEDAMNLTADGTEMVLSLAVSYGGRWDLINAMRALAIEVRTGLLLPEEIDQKRLVRQMSTRDLPDVDLLIRTGGESRVSDFLLFESANAELLVLPKLWPDFDEADVRHALRHYSATERRLGNNSAQLTGRSAGQGFDPHDSVVIAAE